MALAIKNRTATTLVEDLSLVSPPGTIYMTGIREIGPRDLSEALKTLPKLALAFRFKKLNIANSADGACGWFFIDGRIMEKDYAMTEFGMQRLANNAPMDDVAHVVLMRNGEFWKFDLGKDMVLPLAFVEIARKNAPE